jgi:hypothetical protein
MRGKSPQDVSEVSERIDVMVLAASGHRVQDCRRPATTVTPEECVVLAAESLGTEHPFGEVIVDAQLAVLGVATERRPVGLRVGDRLTDRALGQDVASLLGQPLPERCQQRDRLPQAGTETGTQLVLSFGPAVGNTSCVPVELPSRLNSPRKLANSGNDTIAANVELVPAPLLETDIPVDFPGKKSDTGW